MRSGLFTIDRLTQAAFFNFDATDIPKATLHFKSLPTQPIRSAKRRRSVCDVDGEGCSPLQKKKRRLRLNLITSRLSRPYATPATFIGSRGTSRAARWARLRRVGRISLRKAALVNWTRLRKDPAKHISMVPPPAVEVGSLAIKDGDEGLLLPSAAVKDSSRNQTSRLAHAPPCPSPLGLSNYHAIDLEGDPFDEQDWDDTDEDINSDFKIREPEDELRHVDDGPFLDPTSPLFAFPHSSDHSIWSVLSDENSQKEISLASFHTVLPA